LFLIFLAQNYKIANFTKVCNSFWRFFESLVPNVVQHVNFPKAVFHSVMRMKKTEMINQIVEVAGGVGAVVLAEGIERKEEAEIAIELGVQLGQGYYFSSRFQREILLTRQINRG
jgi:c-di-GMP-related signal transduction protein